MKHRIPALVVLALAARPGSVLVAQDARIASGTDVRLVVSPDSDIRGELIAWDADTLRIQDPVSDFVHLVPSHDVERVRVSEPRTRSRGALRGFLIGSIVGALSLGTVTVASPCEAFCFSAGEAFLVGAALGGALGGGAGAAIGAARPGTRWVDVTPHSNLEGGRP